MDDEENLPLTAEEWEELLTEDFNLNQWLGNYDERLS